MAQSATGSFPPSSPSVLHKWKKGLFGKAEKGLFGCTNAAKKRRGGTVVWIRRRRRSEKTCFLSLAPQSTPLRGMATRAVEEEEEEDGGQVLVTPPPPPFPLSLLRFRSQSTWGVGGNIKICQKSKKSIVCTLSYITLPSIFTLFFILFGFFL